MSETPATLTEKPKIAYVVEGHNWYVRVEIPQGDSAIEEALEAATCGVCKFMHGEANIVDASKPPRIAYLCGTWREDGPKMPPNYKLLDSVVLLANAGFFVQSAALQKQMNEEVAKIKEQEPAPEEILEEEEIEDLMIEEMEKRVAALKKKKAERLKAAKKPKKTEKVKPVANKATKKRKKK